MGKISKLSVVVTWQVDWLVTLYPLAQMVDSTMMELPPNAIKHSALEVIDRYTQFKFSGEEPDIRK